MSDLKLLVHKLSRDLEYINIYPLGDLHIGSPEFNLDMWHKWKKTVLADPFGYVVMIGDLLDNGLKTSKTNSYESTIQPNEQKLWLTEELRPLKDRILGVNQGNHEYRTNVLVGTCPLYDVLAKLDLEDVYSPNLGFLKINLGHKNQSRQWSYTIVLAHGASANKVKNFSYAIDGMDIFITGHIHEASSTFPSKIIIDSKNEIVRQQGFVRVVVPSFLYFGGYVMRGMYLPQDNTKFPVLNLSGTSKEVKVSWI